MLGLQGSASTGYSGEVAARAAGNTVLWKGMATSIGQYAPVFLPAEAPLTEKPGRPQSTGLQRFGHDLSDPARIDTIFFFVFCGSFAPMRVDCEGGAAAWLAGTLAAQSVQGHRLPPPQELRPYQSVF